MLKQLFLAYFVPVVTQFGPWKIPKCLEKKPFCDQKWVKKNSPKLIPDDSRGSNKCFLPMLYPCVRVLARGKSQHALKRGRFGTKNGSNTLPKVLLDHSGCSNKCFWPILSPW